jgi:hypothetical protein
MEQFDVFLSHHSSDKPWVIALKAALVERGVTVWLDRDEIRPGDLFVDALEQGVQSSRSLALIVSPASLRSKWVKEEYSRALVLANSSTSEVRIIPCILRSAEVPGFLASRHRIDFSDPAQFEARVDDLCFGITGKKPEAGSARPTLSGHDLTPDDVHFLERWIGELKKESRNVTMMRIGSPLLGLAGASLAVRGSETAMLAALGSATVLGLLGIAATARRWASCSQELKQLTTHRDAIELCTRDYRPVCPDVAEAFNRLLKRRIGLTAESGGRT